MKMKLPLLFVFCVLASAGTASALQTDDLIAVTAMPLAVADVIALPEVPREEVITVVTTLNQAAMPAPQFVEIVRYIPMALVEPAEPRFVTYVTREYQRGVVGEPLALAIADRYDTYGIDDVDILDPPMLTVVERREILPQVVVTRFQPVEFDPLALIAMPLAVAAVADLVDVPRSDLMQFVASLNQALVPAPQFVEVVRYSPVVLVDQTARPQFIRFVDMEVDRGVIGRPLAFAIADRFDAFQPVDIDVFEPRSRVIVERDEILPPVVVRRVARAHPHGGPPGQLKKELGLQTGAEVVHDTRRADRVTRSGRTLRVVEDRDDGRRQATRRVTQERSGRQRAVRNDDDNDRRPRARASRPERRDDDGPRVRQEQRREQPAVRQQRERGRDAKVRGGEGRRGGDDGGKGRGNSGGGKGNGKGKGKGKD